MDKKTIERGRYSKKVLTIILLTIVGNLSILLSSDYYFMNNRMSKENRMEKLGLGYLVFSLSYLYLFYFISKKMNSIGNLY